jgi:outer membrane protein OmpA-like peptidoglycan-associated protein
MQGSVIQCQLEQDIPHYGKAVFTSDASRRPNMNFELQMRRYSPQRIVQANLSSEPPLWIHDRPAQSLGNVTMFPSPTPISIKDQMAWDLLTELEKGMFPTFAYDALVSDREDVKVALSAVNFQPVYDEFLQCVSNLLPYSFDDIAETQLYFEFNRSDFTRKSRQALARIGAWLEADKELELVLLAGHTDNKGSLNYNLRLGKKRADAVKQFFVNAGIPSRQIQVQSFADFQPQSSNATPEGRARNRRVMIKMVK